MRMCAAAILACAAVALAAPTGAAAKFHALAIGAYPPGSRVPISMRELNAYLAAEIPSLIGPGVRHVRIETASGNMVRGTADIDFLKVRQAHGEKPNWLMSQLLEGERPVEITVRLTSSHGMARVDVLKVAISGVVAEGRTLDFLIDNFVVPTFPDVKIGKDFRLDYNIDRLEILPGQAVVVLRSRL
jgi:hypothetical protein